MEALRVALCEADLLLRASWRDDGEVAQVGGAAALIIDGCQIACQSLCPASFKMAAPSVLLDTTVSEPEDSVEHHTRLKPVAHVLTWRGRSLVQSAHQDH